MRDTNKNKNLFKVKSKNEILNEINNKENLGNYKDIENLDENKIDIDDYEHKNEIKLVLFDNDNDNDNAIDELKFKNDKPIVNQKNKNDDFEDLMDFKDLNFDERKN